MPTIEISMKTLEKLAKRKVKREDLEYVKGEIEEMSGGRAKIEIGDTNRPDLWCVEGIARVLRGESMKKIPVKKSGKSIKVDVKMMQIRPFISGFVAKSVNIDEDLLLDMIQLQEKINENFGKKRQKISIGIYNYDTIKFPVHYKAVDPEGTKFIPLGFDEPLTLNEILEKHQKGKDYGYIVRGHNLYPILVDIKQDVLSFPPIINSNYLGKVTTGFQNLLVEVMGTDQKAVLLASNIFAYSLHDRGALIESVITEYPRKTRFGTSVVSPYDFGETMTFDASKVEIFLGLNLRDVEIKNLLEKMQYRAFVKNGSVTVKIPPYRNDIMHYTDVIEDIAIAYGYENISSLEIESFTVGKLKNMTFFAEKVRRTMTGAGFLEIMSAILSSKESLCGRMNSESAPIEIENPMTENYSCVRDSILPTIMACLAKNMHNEYPQKVFELGECVIRDGRSDDGTRTVMKISAAVSGNDVGYEDISSFADALLSCMGIEYEIKAASNPRFIEGRTGEMFIKGRRCGIVGEIHPKVLNNWFIEKPVAAFEMDVDELMELSKK